MGLFTRKPTTELPVKPCNRPKMAMLVEGIGLVEISYSNRQQPWCLSREEHAAYLSERPDELTIARIKVQHHSTTVIAADIECMEVNR